MCKVRYLAFGKEIRELRELRELRKDYSVEELFKELANSMQQRL